MWCNECEIDVDTEPNIDGEEACLDCGSTDLEPLEDEADETDEVEVEYEEGEEDDDDDIEF